MARTTYIIDPKDYKVDFYSVGCLGFFMLAGIGFTGVGLFIVLKGDQIGWLFTVMGFLFSLILVWALLAGRQKDILKIDANNQLTVAKGDPKNLKFQHSGGLLLTITLEFLEGGGDSDESVYTLNLLTSHERVMLGQYVKVEEKAEILQELVEWLGNENGFKIKWRDDFSKKSGEVNVSEDD